MSFIVQKIKKNLIRKAQLKKSYSKLKSREPELFQPSENSIGEPTSAEEAAPEASLELHPERQAMLDNEDPEPSPKNINGTDRRKDPGSCRRPRPTSFGKEVGLANQQREERTARRSAFEEANREREAKQKERGKFRKVMLRAKTAGKSHNERRLGRESKVLLEKVKRMVQG